MRRIAPAWRALNALMLPYYSLLLKQVPRDFPEKTPNGEPDGFIKLMWHHIDSLEMPTAQNTVRTTIGWVALIGAVLLFGGLAGYAPELPTRRAA